MQPTHLGTRRDKLQFQTGIIHAARLATHPIFETLMRSSGGADLLERASQASGKRTPSKRCWKLCASAGLRKEDAGVG